MGAFPKGQFDQPGVLAQPTRELYGALTGLDIGELDHPSLRLGDDLLGDDDHVFSGNRVPGRFGSARKELTHPVAGLDLRHALDRDDLDPRAHFRASAPIRPSCSSAARVAGARSGSASRTAVIASRSSGVSTSSTSEGSGSTATSWPIRSDRSAWRAQLPGPNA